MRQRVLLTAGLALVFFLPLANALGDDEPEVAVEASANEIFIGESIDYVVEIRNVKNPAAPDLTALRQDFDVVANGDESHNQSSTFIFNGRVTQQTSFGHAYRFRLTPKRTGKLSIAGPTVTVDGKSVTGRALDLTVIAPEPQDLVIPEIKIDRTRLYPTQPFEITLRVFVRPLPNDSDRDPVAPLRRRPPHIDINWLEPPPGLSGESKKSWLEKLLADNEVGFTLNDVTTQSGAFSFFSGPRQAVFGLEQGREKRNGLGGQPVNYFVYDLKRKLTAEKAGTYKLGPAIVKGTFIDGEDAGTYSGRRLVAVAPAVSLEVREVPGPRPATYCGGIGAYRLAAVANPTSLRVGDPLTLSLNIERGPASGSLDLISAPDLAANSALAADFEILDKSPTGHRQGDSKRFDYALRPKRAGVTIPALAMTVFDPDTEKFSEITTEPIALDVSQASQLNAGELVGAVASSSSPEIKSRSQGIFQNVTDLSEIKDERVNVRTLVLTTLGLWCAVGCLIGVVAASRSKAGDLVGQRRRGARRSAERKLGEARAGLAAGRSSDALRSVRSAIVGLIGDTRNIVADGLTAVEAELALAKASVPASDRLEIKRLLESIESAEYGSGSEAEASNLIAAADRLIPGLARHLERSG